MPTGLDLDISASGKCTVDRMIWGDRSRDVFVDFFLGGKARVGQLTAFFAELKQSGATLCVLTKGETAAVRLLYRLFG